MSEEESEETRIFLPKKVEYDNHEEEWDDTKLIKAYDKAVSKAKRQICSKLQAELGLTDADIQEVLSDTGTPGSKKKNKKKKKKVSAGKKGKWKVGSACRAMFSEDGEDYEAEIISMIDTTWCKVKFIGYDNEEEVLLEELTPSLGNNVIELQIEMAKQDAALEELVLDSEDEDETQSRDYQLPQEAAAEHPNLMRPPRRPPMFQPSSPPPPPPSFPLINKASFSKFAKPMNGASMAHLPTGDEAQNAMMLSWFMCGYYTGYYQRNVDQHLCDKQH